MKLAIFLLGLVFILTAGVDLNYNRAGIGLMILGISAVLLSVRSFQTGERAPLWSSGFVFIGVFYFLWRGYVEGPVTFQFSDGVLTLVLATTFLSVLTLRLKEQAVLLWMFTILGVANAFWALPEILSVLANEGGRITGFFGHYNYFTAFANVCFFAALSLALKRGGKYWVKILLIASLLVIGSVIFLANSRGGWLALLGGSFIFGVIYIWSLYRRGSRKLAPVTVGFIIILLTGAFTVTQKFRGIQEARGPQQIGSVFNDGGRLVFQQWAANFFLESPMVGNGPRSFEYMALQNWDFEDLEYHFPDPDFVHNEFIQLLTDYGLVGFFIVIIGIFICSVRALAKCASSLDSDTRESNSLYIFAFSALASLLLQSCLSFLFHTPSLIGVLGVVLGVLFGSATKEKKSLQALFIHSIPAGLIATVGVFLSASFYYQHQASKAMDSGDQSQALALNMRAARLAHDSELAERVGIQAYSLSIEAKEPDTYRIQALDSFVLALELNEYSLVGLCSYARVLDDMGRHSEACKVHQRAVNLAWARELYLRPMYYAARNQVYLAQQAIEAKDFDAMYLAYKKADELMEKRKEIFRWDPKKDSRKFATELRSWIHYFEAQRLYFHGDALWKKRKPEEGMAFMNEAKKRYLSSKKSVRPKDPLWQIQYDRLNENLKILVAARIVPAGIELEEMERVAKGLESFPATR